MLEHVPQPQALLREVTRILRPGGLFWATTPHGRGLSARALKMDWSTISPPEHLQLLSTHGAKTLLASVGFHRVGVSTQGINPYEILHVLRQRRAQFSESEQKGDSFSRVDSGYQLNEYLTGSPSRRLIKQSANALLSVTQLGDSLKIRAVL